MTLRRLLVVTAVLATACGAKSTREVDSDVDIDTDVDTDVDTDSDTDTHTDIGACSDRDGDGFGVGSACLGPDCDDSDPDVWADIQCSGRCEHDLHADGCPCDPAESPEPEICYTGPPATLGVGNCRAGLRVCTEWEWSVCEGQVIPVDETCDGEDDDCDGEIDEGIDCGGD